jgi:N-formylglutamate amidohydrolase
LFDDPLPPFANSQSVRVVGGLGTLARIVADNEEIYRDRMPVARALERIERLYKPFHAALARLIDDTRRRFGFAVLVDCHSMPSASIGQPASARPDIVLGDRYGASCDVKVIRGLRAIFAEGSYEVHLNRPYAGGFITEHYGRPHRGVHAVQIEVNRALYLNEANLERGARFDALRTDFTRMMARVTSELPAFLGGRAAAE